MTYELPQQCHVVLPGLPAGSNIAVCVRGEQGVRITQLNFGDSVAARRIVAAFNVTLTVHATRVSTAHPALFERTEFVEA